MSIINERKVETESVCVGKIVRERERKKRPNTNEI